jgi:hypothetical protein
MTILTIFTTPKPFINPHIATIQRNAIRSWKSLGEDVKIFLVGEEEGVATVADDISVEYIPEVDRNTSGTPLISSIFQKVHQQSSSALYAYVNADILLLSDFLATAESVRSQSEKFLVVGQRWDMNITELMQFPEDWEEKIWESVRAGGKLHKPAGSDYFLYPRGCFEKIPDFAVGRAGWDNWMIYEARMKGWQVVNATGSINIIHQNHDYSHLPDGKPHYRLPETNENIRLAGGPRTIFTLMDANFSIRQGKVSRIKRGWLKFWRDVEVFPLVSLRSNWLAHVFYAIFHPARAFRDLRSWLYKVRK